MSTPVLITGAAGFIGFHLARRLLALGRPVVGIDNLDPYYDVALKRARLAELAGNPGWRFVQGDIQSHLADAMQSPPNAIVHLAAQAGIRHSLQAPESFIQDNLQGFFSVLEAARQAGIEHLVYASSSSVYGADPLPFSEDARADHPLNLYAATKRSNELMAHAYSHLHGFGATGLRLFTVYGPWGRPDMALFKFTRRILAGEPLPVFGQGQMERDFSYVDDVVDAILAVLDAPQGARVLNVGCGRPVGLLDMIRSLESALGVPARLELLPMQPGDAPRTHADTRLLAETTGLEAQVDIDEGIRRFVAWYRGYYGV